jgi:hypothetical protein
MTEFAKWCGIAVCTLSISACGSGQDADQAQDQGETAPPSGTVGDTGTAESTTSEEPALTTRDALPGTASPFPLVGGTGALLVCTAQALRHYSRRRGRSDRS